MITHFVRHDDEAAAKAALPAYWTASEDGWDWNRSIVDGPVPVVDGEGNPRPGYFLNIGLPELDASMPGLTGAGYGPADDFTLVHGTAPESPQRVFV